MPFELLMLLVFILSVLIGFVVFKMSGRSNVEGVFTGLFRGSSAWFAFIASFSIALFISHARGVEFAPNVTQNLIDYPWSGSAYIAISAIFFYFARRKPTPRTAA
jgi:hypothetical protein